MFFSRESSYIGKFKAKAAERMESMHAGSANIYHPPITTKLKVLRTSNTAHGDAFSLCNWIVSYGEVFSLFYSPRRAEFMERRVLTPHPIPPVAVFAPSEATKVINF